MMRNVKLILMMLSLVALAGVAGGAVVYQNDFGTQAQIDAFSWHIPRGGHVAEPGPTPPGDLDNDGLYQALRQTSSWSLTQGAKAIYAPAFTTMSNITVSGYGRGHWGAHASGVRWDMSADGATYEHMVQTDNSNAWKQYSTDVAAHADPAYTDISKVYARVTSQYSSGGAYSSSYAARHAAFQVAADINPGQVGDVVNLTRNDFGTISQRDEWTVTGNTPVVYTNNPALDRDSDDLAAVVGIDAVGWAALELRIDAPAGVVFTNPVATATGYGSHSSWGSYANVSFSTDGENWEYTSSQPTTGYGSFLIATGDTSADSAYDSLSTLYVRVYLRAYNAVGYPNIRDLGITAEIVPEPATMLLLSLGALPLLRRRR